MNIKLGSTHTIRWCTADPATGAAANASSQTVSVFEEATDTAILTPTATNVSTGSYRTDIVATAGNGFDAGKAYNVEVAATVGGVATKMIVLTFKVDAKSIDELPAVGAEMSLSTAGVTKVWSDNIGMGPGTYVWGSAGHLLVATTWIRGEGYADGVQTENTLKLDPLNLTFQAKDLPATVRIVSGQGEGQCRNIVAYDDTTGTVTVDVPWAEVPDITSEYLIASVAPNPSVVVTGRVVSAGASTAVLDARASAADNAYQGCVIAITSGTGAGQTGRILGYDGTTKTVTIDNGWNVAIPDSTSTYTILASSVSSLDSDSYLNIQAIKSKTDNLPPSPAAVGSEMTLAIGAITAAVVATGAIDADALATDAVAEIADGVWDEAIAGHATAGSTGATLAAIPTDAENATAIGTRALGHGLTVDMALRVAGTLAASKKSGMVPGQAGTTVIRNYDDSGDLITATQDANGNTTAVTVTP